MNVPSKKVFIDAFAPAIFEIIKAIKKVNDPYLKKKLKEALMSILRKFTDRPAVFISKRAKTLAESKEIDLCDKLWSDRNILGTTDGKSDIVWEHSTPVNVLADDLLKCKDLNCVHDILNSYSGVIWITRAEDDCLIKKGIKKAGLEDGRIVMMKVILRFFPVLEIPDTSNSLFEIQIFFQYVTHFPYCNFPPVHQKDLSLCSGFFSG